MAAIPIETLQLQLSQARQAYHQLMVGTLARVVVDIDGSRVEFSATNKQQLYAYIQKLESQVCPAPAPQAGPLGFYF